MKDIANVVMQGDIAVIQEVTHKDFSRELLTYLHPYGYHGAYQELPESQDKEEAFFLFNREKVKLLGIHPYPNTPRVFQRAPTTALFSVAHKKLAVMNYHANFGEGNSEEIIQLPIAADEARKHFGIENLVIAADTNLGSDKILSDPYFSNFGMWWPQRFPKPGVSTTNGREPATYDYIIWDGAHLVPLRSSVIKYKGETKFLIDSVFEKDKLLGKILPCVRKKLRKEILNISDHWAIKVEFYLGKDYSLDELNKMPLLNCLPLYMLRTLRRYPTIGYDFPPKLVSKYNSGK
jgi:hypothetical protein